jgi:hypothetical protein
VSRPRHTYCPLCCHCLSRHSLCSAHSSSCSPVLLRPAACRSLHVRFGLALSFIHCQDLAVTVVLHCVGRAHLAFMYMACCSVIVHLKTVNHRSARHHACIECIVYTVAIRPLATPCVQTVACIVLPCCAACMPSAGLLQPGLPQAGALVLSVTGLGYVVQQQYRSGNECKAHTHKGFKV